MSATCTRSEPELVTGARRRALVTLLFCDLRGFTPLAAGLDPIEVHAMLTAYYENLSPVLVAYGGRVVQYTGDEIFAVFEGPGDADRALRAAIALRDGLDRLNTLLVARELPALRLGIGVHRGDVVMAAVEFGALQQLTVMGDAVNVARRYCSAAEPGQVVFSASVRAAVGRPPLHRTVAEVALKGVDGTVTVYVVAPPRPAARCPSPTPGRPTLATPVTVGRAALPATRHGRSRAPPLGVR